MPIMEPHFSCGFQLNLSSGNTLQSLTRTRHFPFKFGEKEIAKRHWDACTGSDESDRRSES
jgi:hypothetical protein